MWCTLSLGALSNGDNNGFNIEDEVKRTALGEGAELPEPYRQTDLITVVKKSDRRGRKQER